MGINHFGEMHNLSRIARPDICIMTNIGQCHLEFLGSREGILKAKSEMFDFMKEDGSVCINGDDDMLEMCIRDRYMTWEGQIIEPAYFWLSAGKTRNGKEVFGDGYDYLISVDCSHDIERCV